MSSAPALSPTRSFSRSSLKRSGAIVLGLRLVTAAAMFGLQVVIAQALGDTGFGVYAFAMAWMQGLAVFGRAGMERSSLRQIAEHRTRGEVPLLAGFLRWSRKRTLLASLAAAAFLAIAAVTVIAPNDPTTRSALLLAACTLPVLTTRQVAETQLRAVHNVWQSMLGPALWPLLLAGAALIVHVGLDWTLTPSRVIGLQLSAFALCWVMVISMTRRSPLADVPRGHLETQKSAWKSAALTFLAFDAVILLKGRTSVIIAGMMIDTDTAGIYAAAERFSEVVLLGVVSINMFTAPHFASLHASGDRTTLRELIRGSQYLGLAFAVPVGLLMMVFGRPLLGLLGSSFVVGYPLLVVLLIATMIGALAGPAVYVLAMSGQERTTLNGSILCMVVNLIASFSLTPFFGAMGLAVTHLLTTAVWTVYMLVHLRRHLNSLG